MTGVFDYVNSINHTKEHLMHSELDERDYVPFIVNRALSYFPDTLFYANEVNCIPNMDVRLQYDYLINTVSRRKRFSKWAKKSDSEDVKAVMEYYGINRQQATTAVSILSRQEIEHIQLQLHRGGAP